MKKFISQMAIGFVAMLLGFMVISQIKIVHKKLTFGNNGHNQAAIATENEQLKMELDTLQTEIDKLAQKNERFKNAGAGSNDERDLIMKNLEEARFIAGLSEVKGEGIVINIVPKTNLATKPINNKPIIDLDLLVMINKLWSAGAEAISVNDIRLVGTSGIRTAGNYSIIINNQRVSPHQRVTVKAIGNKLNLQGALRFPGAITEELSRNCNIELETSNNIVIKEGHSAFIYRYAKQIN